MSENSSSKLEWWHKAFLLLIGALMFNQIKGCMGWNTQANQQNASGNMLQSLNFSKRDACDYIHGQQYPYDWKGSNTGACVIKLPTRFETVMAPDPLSGIMIPQTQTVDNEVSIRTPIGDGAGVFEGNYVNGVVSTSNGDIQIACLGTAITNSSRGICGIR